MAANIAYRLVQITCLTALIVSAAAPSVAEKVLRRGLWSSPGTLDPQRAWTVAEDHVIGELFVGLLTMDAEANLIPGAADHWQISNDGRTYRFNLRAGQRWSDGQDLTADDFVFAFRRLVAPDAPLRQLYEAIVNAKAITAGELAPSTLGVRALDDLTLEISLSRPVPYFRYLLQSAFASPVPRHIVNRHGAAWTEPAYIVSNGPFHMTVHEKGRPIRLEKNRYFYDVDQIELDAIEFHYGQYRELAPRYFSGELDIIEGSAKQTEWIDKNYERHTNVSPELSLFYLVFNFDHEKFLDSGVRKAMSLAIDRESLSRRLLHGGYIPTYGMTPPAMAGYQSQVTPPTMSRLERLTEAQRLMKNAGYSADRPMYTVIRYNEDVDNQKVMTAVAQALQEVYVHATLDEIAASEDYWSELVAGRFEIARGGWRADYLDPQAFLDLLRDGFEGNYGSYSNIAYEQLISRADVMLDSARRNGLLAQAESLVMAENPIIPLFWRTSMSLVAPHVKGWRANLFDIHRARWLHFDRSYSDSPASRRRKAACQVLFSYCAPFGKSSCCCHCR